MLQGFRYFREDQRCSGAQNRFQLSVIFATMPIESAPKIEQRKLVPGRVQRKFLDREAGPATGGNGDHPTARFCRFFRLAFVQVTFAICQPGILD